MKRKDVTPRHSLKTGILWIILICAGFVPTAFSYDDSRIDDALVGFPRAGEAPLEVHFTSPLPDKVTGFLWDFGDEETSTQQSPDHVYITPGSYTVVLTVTGSGGTSKEIVRKDYITVYESSQLTADFSAEPISGSPPLTVKFKDASTGNITQWLWVFGDNETSSEQNPEHFYTAPGKYTVVLRVSGLKQSDVKRKFQYIDVKEDALIADFSADPLSGTQPLTVSFTDESTGSIAEWLWNFGDGGSSIEHNPRHTYEQPGTYFAGLRIKGPGGGDSEFKEEYITVSPQSFQRYSLSGTIHGQESGQILVHLSGQAERKTGTMPDGKYVFEGLKPGKYRITPFQRDIIFDTPSRPVTITNQDIEGVDFTAVVRGPSFIAARGIPQKVRTGNNEPVLFMVNVYHPLGFESITRVTLDLKLIGGSSRQTMYDDGTHGDENAEDGIYVFETTVAADIPPGPKGIVVVAEDESGVKSFAAIDIVVIRDVRDTVRMNSLHSKTVTNEVAGQTLVLSFSLSEENMSTASSADDGCSVFLQLFTPLLEAFFDDPLSITSQTSEVEIPDAESGEWTYEITNECSENKEYSLSISSSGTGVVSGMVVDADTGQGLNEASVVTNTGTSSITEDGYYILLIPAGVFSIKANVSGADFRDATQSVSMNAGETKEVDFIMTPSGSDNDTACVLSFLLNGYEKSQYLDTVRVFRDGCLRKTPFGRSLIALYYRFSPEVVTLLRDNLFLRK